MELSFCTHLSTENSPEKGNQLPDPQSLTESKQRLCSPPLGFHRGFYPRQR